MRTVFDIIGGVMCAVGAMIAMAGCLFLERVGWSMFMLGVVVALVVAANS